MKYKTIFEAARAKIRAEALSSLSSIDVMLHSPESTDADTIVDKMVEAAKNLAMYEGALITLNQYFEPKAPAPPQPAPPPPPANTPAPEPAPPIKVTEDMSPTYKRAVAKEKIKKTARAAAKKAASKTKNKEG